MNAVNRRIPKLDARALTTGKGVYTDDLIPPGALTVKVLRSPHPFARVMAVRADAARRLNGIACVLTADDLPKIRFTQAGQSYPEPSPYDRYILEDLVRYVGDPVAIVAGESEQVVDQALRMIRVDYQQLDPVLDYETALDHPSVVHPEQDYFNNFPVGGDPQRNLVASGERSGGDLERVFFGMRRGG